MAFAIRKPAEPQSDVATAVLKHYEELRAFIRRKVGCPATAADLLQETYLRVATANAGASIENQRAYVYRVAGNLVTDHLRQNLARGRIVGPDAIPEALPDLAPNAERSLSAKQRLSSLKAAVDELPPRCRTVFVMRRFQDIGQDEIASRLGISRNMVEKHLRHALAHCARRLAELD
jgi:RNA polymerase sigma-70 factor (ECF subfamily)